MTERPFLVLVPGLFSTEILWQRQVEILSEIADIHVTQQHLRHDSLEAISEAILAESPPSFAIAGVSTGGYSALLAQKLGGERVTGLCLIGSTTNLGSESLGKGLFELEDMVRQEEFERCKQSLISLFLNHDNQRSRSMATVVDTMVDTVGVERTLQQLAFLRKGGDLQDDLNQITCPTLLICGAEDKLMPPQLSRQAAKSIQRSKLVIVEGAAHLLPLERPETVAELMRNWLAGELALDRQEIII